MFGFVGLVAAPAAAGTPQVATSESPSYEFYAECKPDPDHALLVVKNKSDKGFKYAIKKVYRDGDQVDASNGTEDHSGTWDYTGYLKPGEKDSVKVPYKSPKDTWGLWINYRFQEKLKVGDLDWCPPSKDDFGFAPVCKIDDSHMKVRIYNNYWKDAYFVLKLVDANGQVVKGTVKAQDDTYVKVDWMSPDDTWLLKIYFKDHKYKDFWYKAKIGDAKPCKKPSPSPSESPSESPSMSPTTSPTPGLPVTGSSSIGFLGVGLSMLGVGAAALLIARRRRRFE